MNNKFITIVLVSTFFGLAGGWVGALAARSFFADGILGAPFFGEINIPNSAEYGWGNLVIRDAKKVVIEQNEKVGEITKSLAESVVGIFKIKSVAVKKTAGVSGINIDEYYELSQEAGQGFIVTSDGWIVAAFIPDELKNSLGKADNAIAAAKESVLADYVIIMDNKEVNTIDNIVVDPVSMYSFWHINKKDLVVRKFLSKEEIAAGQSVIMFNWEKSVDLANITDIDSKYAGPVRSSDYYGDHLQLSPQPTEDFKNAFLFNYNGDLAGIIGGSGKVDPVYNYAGVINYLLKNKYIGRPMLGVNYIDLNRYAGQEGEIKGALLAKDKSGVAVAKNSPAEKAGFKEGDIITAVNNTVINGQTDLARLVSQYAPGDEITIGYKRGERELSANVALEELK